MAQTQARFPQLLSPEGTASGPTVMSGRARGNSPNPVDVHVGGRLRLRRTLLGLSQEKLGDAIGLTFQQVQKYERGANRIGASRLHQLSQVLEVPVAFFFEGLTDPSGRGEAECSEDDDPLLKRETLELVRAYYRIADPQVRRRIFELTKTLGESPSR